MQAVLFITKSWGLTDKQCDIALRLKSNVDTLVNILLLYLNKIIVEARLPVKSSSNCLLLFCCKVCARGCISACMHK